MVLEVSLVAGNVLSIHGELRCASVVISLFSSKLMFSIRLIAHGMTGEIHDVDETFGDRKVSCCLLHREEDK